MSKISADHFACILDQLISGSMSKGVICMLQPVDITDHDRQLVDFSFADHLVQMCFGIRVGMFVLDTRQGVRIGHFTEGS